MNTDDVTDVLRLLAGHWPNPELGEDEIRVWTRTLANLNMQGVIQTIDLLSQSGRTWRPSDGEFLAEYRRQQSRVPQATVDRGEVPELPVSTDRKTPEQWMAEIKSKVKKAKPRSGQISVFFASITQGLQLDPAHPFPESVHQRGMAQARQMSQPKGESNQ